ncbi:TPA: hypothetical protein ACSTLU_000115 [Serratia fonticola]
MKERPIIFNAEMVRAILDGRKTQTRRVMRVQPESPELGLSRITEAKNSSDTGKYFWSLSDALGSRPRSKLFPCPFGQVGDRLWVRETCQAKELESGLDVICYPADGAEIQVKAHPLDAGNWIDLYRYRSKEGIKVPSIHMPRHACRLVLEITDVRVERLNSISEEDALAEGIRRTDNNFGNGPAYCDYMLANLNDVAEWYNRPSDSFISLWQSIYGAESWQHSPWVWVIEFKRVGGSS